MTTKFKGWDEVAAKLVSYGLQGGTEHWPLSPGQRASLCGIAKRLPHNGVLIADEVGMGKTRIAVALAKSVMAAHGRVAIVVPRGLGFQWRDELHAGGVNAPGVIHNLWSFLEVWRPGQAAPGAPAWFEQPLVLLSHNFTNWRFGGETPAWRWSLLPALVAHLDPDPECAKWLKRELRKKFSWEQTPMLAGASIATALLKLSSHHPLRRRAESMMSEMSWKHALKAAYYGRGEDMRKRLETAVGLGLGAFDLVIIDEAHKSRGDESVLSGVLDGVIIAGNDARRVGMTATPVELETSQWGEMLKRIGVPFKDGEGIFRLYAEACARVRHAPRNEEACETYRNVAARFQTTLSPYLLRRDKRELQCVKDFETHSGLPAHEYRQHKKISIEAVDLPPAWLQAVCAAEALSIVTRQADDPTAKRLRLTLGNGHGIATLLDQAKRDDKDDAEQEKHDKALLESDAMQLEISDLSYKRQQRALWWKKLIVDAFGDDARTLYGHPAIRRVAEEIEKIGGKVLVFGRFTLPLRALTALLNARAMLRALDTGKLWPQEQVHDSEWEAVQAAYQQLGYVGEADRSHLNERLKAQYATLRNQRERERTQLVKIPHEAFAVRRIRAVFEAFQRSVELHDGKDESPLVLVSKALHSLSGSFADEQTQAALITAFEQLIEAALEQDEGRDDREDMLDDSKADALWRIVRDRLEVEYNRTEGSFARLMYGGTAHDTRRLLQLAFNRPHSHPHVLVAQSIVGREGLNLHHACRTVILLHPEWNPGVVEQQIGRVDRVDSLWERELTDALQRGQIGEALPRIMVHPIIFRGTYDEANWNVLLRRWDDLRAQLNGIVIPRGLAEDTGLSPEECDRINSYAPDFRPECRAPT